MQEGIHVGGEGWWRANLMFWQLLPSTLCLIFIWVWPIEGRKESTWVGGGGWWRVNLMLWQLLPSSSLDIWFFLRVWPIQGLFFEIRHVLKEMYPPGYLAQETHRYIYNNAMQRAQISQKQDRYNIRNDCLVIPKNGFVTTQALSHMMYVMYSELLHCI